MSGVRVIRPDERKDTAQTPGMVREEAFTGPGFWSGAATADPGTSSGWHHHGDHDTVVYVVSGTFRVESGPGGRDVVDTEGGDFVLIPKRVVHRETNIGTEPSSLALVRVGTGEPVTNLEGPDPG